MEEKSLKVAVVSAGGATMGEAFELFLDGDRIIYNNDSNATPIATIPTRRNPDVMVTIGQKNDGSFVPMTLSYPESYGADQVARKVQQFKAKDGCELCDRFEREQRQRQATKKYRDSRYPLLALVSEQRPSVIRFISNLRGR